MHEKYRSPAFGNWPNSFAIKSTSFETFAFGRRNLVNQQSQNQNLTDSVREQKMIDLFLKIETSDLEKEFLKNIHTAILQNSKNCLMQKMKAIYDNK